MGRYNHIRHARTIIPPQTKGNYRLFKNGSPLFEQLFQDISDASVQVDVYFFLVEKDYITENFLNVLKNKAREGVPVRFMVDRLGGHKVTKEMRIELEDAGVDFQFAEKPGFPYFFYRLNRRNHRKVTVVDGKYAYVGGFNIGKNYMGESSTFGNWRDYHLRLTGPIVEDLHRVFLDDWYLATGIEEQPLPSTSEGSHRIQMIATDGVGLEEEFVRMIQSAEKEVLIGSPYFIPTKTLMDSFLRVLKKGIHVKILIPMKSDHPFVKEAALPYLKNLHEHGATIRFFDAGFYHSKMIIIDEAFADIGTANFDRRSLFLNKEVNTYIYEKGFIRDLRETYLEDFNDGYPFDEHWWKIRSVGTKIREKIAVLLRPFL
ncbi:cardiolipin synthase [Halobacillus yeomjeoni]|uniref:cardiolipin synthase n=1 Tax=Halobacillus yeomjeoni TaxID=311194 RepID=UPI001CD5E853|nr:cardiolipin synthase [Halobacillus yeomjeoni]MCA0985440.1 cardiolipin synthase [Halobacillus yeomjeoni]